MASKRARVIAGLLFLSSLLAARASASPPPQAGEKRSSPRTDRYGDPLPEGAIARIGTIRFRDNNAIHSICYCPDGKILAAIGNDGVRLWDAVTGKVLHSYNLPASSQEKSIPWIGYTRGFFSPDGQRLWLQSSSSGRNSPGKEIYFWDLAPAPEPRPRKAPFSGKDLHLLALSPNGKFLAISDQSGIRICNTASGEDSQRLRVSSYQACYSTDGKMLVSSNGAAILFWNVQTGEQIRSIVAGDRLSRFGKIVLAPDSKTVAALHRNRGTSIHLYDAATGNKRRELQVSDSAERDLIISPDGKVLVFAGQQRLCAWDVSSGKLLWEHHDFYHPLSSVAFSPDSKTLAAGGGVEVRLYDPATGEEHLALRNGERITGLGLLGDGRTVVSVAPEKPLRLWRLPNAEEIPPAPGQKRPVVPIVDDVSPDGKWMASGGHADGAVRIWDLVSGKEIHRLTHVQSPACSFSPDGRWLQTHDYVQDPIRHTFEHVLRFWDARTAKMVKELRGKQASVARFSPDGRLYATQGPPHGTCYVATVPEGSVVQTIATPNGPWRFFFSPDSRLLAGASLRDVTPHLWEVASGKEVALLFDKPKGRRGRGWPGITEVRFSPNGRKLLAGDSEGRLFCWDVEGRLLRQWKGDDFAVNCLSLTPDEKLLVTGGNTTGLVWNMDEVLPSEKQRTTMLTAADLNTLWSHLEAEDATQAWRAVWKLAATPDQAVPFLRERLQPASEPHKTNAEKIAKFIDDLDNDTFAVREKAIRELGTFGKEAEPALRKALASSPSAESKRRIEDLLGKMPESPPAPPPELLRQLRALAVLEYAGTPAAKRCLETLAGGVAEARLTREARSALARLTRNSKTAP